MYEIVYTEGVVADFKGLKANQRKQILDKVEEQLLHQPVQETRNKKIVEGLKPPWDHEEPVWELRIGDYRIFYDVDEKGQRVLVRSVRRKPPHRTTEDIL
jgi:mRNA-degrading endonuclease RelE of RelBE toxin-antitoxin system